MTLTIYLAGPKASGKTTVQHHLTDVFVGLGYGTKSVLNDFVSFEGSADVLKVDLDAEGIKRLADMHVAQPSDLVSFADVERIILEVGQKVPNCPIQVFWGLKDSIKSRLIDKDISFEAQEQFNPEYPFPHLRGQPLHAMTVAAINQYLDWCHVDETEWDAMSEDAAGIANATRRRKLANIVATIAPNMGMSVVPSWAANLKAVVDLNTSVAERMTTENAPCESPVPETNPARILQQMVEEQVGYPVGDAARWDRLAEMCAYPAYIVDMPEIADYPGTVIPAVAEDDMRVRRNAIANLDRRMDGVEQRNKDLLEANNALLERARAAEEALYLMREFAIRNGAKWLLGAQTHPIWQHVAEILHPHFGQTDINDACRYAFIYPTNTQTLEALRQGTAPQPKLGDAARIIWANEMRDGM